MAKNIAFLDFFVLIKGIYDIVQANNIYLYKVDTMDVYVIIIWHFSQFWIVHMGYIQQFGEVT